MDQTTDFLIDLAATSRDIPEQTRLQYARWTLWATEPGSFIAATLRNELVRSFERADQKNTYFMRQIASFLYNLPLEIRNLDAYPKRSLSERIQIFEECVNRKIFLITDADITTAKKQAEGEKA